MGVRSAIAAVAFTAATTVAVVLPGGPAMAASCPDNNWSIIDARHGYFFNASNVNIRTGPSTTCPAIGQGQPSHYIALDCWTLGGGGYTWSHIYDSTARKTGWVRDDYLVGDGARYHC